MKAQISVAALFITVLMLPMISVSADGPQIDYADGNTTFTWSGSATTVELIGEWDWNAITTLAENSGNWVASLPLSEGIYCYKFIVDGEYIFDPTNPYRGYCDDIENSVVRVKNSDRPNFASNLSSGILTITFLPGASGAGPDGTPVGLEDAIWDSNAMTWTLDTSTFSEGKHTIKLELSDTNGNQAYDHLVPFWVGEQSEFVWDDSLIYMIMTDRFINGNTSNDGTPTGAAAGADWLGGDLEGVTSKIQSGYFAELGVNVLWLTPFNTNAQGTGLAADGVHEVSAFHGYWPVEPRQVDPRLGSADQLKEMVAAAHTAGIRVMMDYVVNHVHEDHIYYQENPEWFNQGCICGSDNCDWTEHRLDCQFTPYMPDVNWKVRDASEQFIADALWWLEEFDLDGARIDAVKHVDDLAATNLATRINERFETVGTDYYLKGETAMGWSGDNLADNQFQYETINRYIGEDSLDGQADFVLYHAVVDNVFTQASRNYQHLDYWTNRSQDQYSPGAIMVPYVGSHDVPRLASRADRGTGDAYNQWQEQGLPGQPGTDETYQTVMQAYGWLLTTPGAPLLYYGDEYGEYGGADPDNRHMYRDSTNWNDRERALFENISTLGKLRLDSIALKQGVYSTKHATPDLLIYEMSHDDQIMSIVLNRGADATHYGFDASDVVRFGTATISQGELFIPANSVTVIEQDALAQAPPRDQDGDCLIVDNFNINATYLVSLDLINTCDKEIHYPGVNSTLDNSLIEGFPDYTEWFYLIYPNSSYPMNWQLSLDEAIENDTLVSLTFTASILNCSDEDNSSQWHYCPDSSITHTFIVNPSNNQTNDNDTHGQPTAISGCTDSTASNYSPDATADDGSCQYPTVPVLGCTDALASNYNSSATQDDGSCQFASGVEDNDTEIDTPTIDTNDTELLDNNPVGNVTDDTNLSDDNMATSEDKSSISDFVRNGLAVAIFCGLIVLFFTSRREP